MVDGSEQEFGPGDVGVIPSGHDAWVVGSEPAVVIDISGMTHYAKPAPIRSPRVGCLERQAQPEKWMLREFVGPIVRD
jgi:hypothetical protein